MVDISTGRVGVVQLSCSLRLGQTERYTGLLMDRAVADYIRLNFDELRLRALANFAERLEWMTPAEAAAAGVEGDLEEVPALAELEKAYRRILSLTALGDLQTDH